MFRNYMNPVNKYFLLLSILKKMLLSVLCLVFGVAKVSRKLTDWTDL